MLEQLGLALPRYATMPTPGALHDLRALTVTARTLGTPLMPWQSFVGRVTSERSPADPRRFRYTLCILTVPRQAGKTTIMRTILAQRAIMNQGRRAFYTAQTGKDAAERWKDLVKAIEQSPLKDLVVVRRAAGSQALTFPNGSTIAPFAPTAKSLHGYTPHDVMVDEVFEFDSAEGNDLMGAIGPAQVTLVDRQLWLVSTAGSAESTFLREWVDAGRLAVNDPTSDIAYFEWSAADGLDYYDPETWTFHPALGHTITLDDLAQLAARESPGNWLRYYMNRWTSARNAVIAPEAVEAAATAQAPPPASTQIRLAYEVAGDRSRSAIVAAWEDPFTRRPAIRVVKSAPGFEWLTDSVLQLADEWRPHSIGADDGGPTRAITDEIRKRRPLLELEILGARDFATATDNLVARMRNGTMSHDNSPPLLQSLEAATVRTMGQSYAWDRVKSTAPIPELIAGTVALRLLEQAPAPKPSPLVHV